MNWKYFLIGVLRRHVPEKLLFAVMKHRGDGSIAEIGSDTYLATWGDQLGRHDWSFADKHVLEVGSGRYARFALQMLAAGADRVTLIDLYAVPLNEPGHRAMLARDCENLALDCDDAFSRIEVIRTDITSLPAPAPEERVDLVISNAVLEHVRDPEAILACCWKWLKPGGSTHHMIDLRDHNLRFQYPFEMLTFSDQVWERWLALRGGFHLNRWRASDYLHTAHEAGFVNVNYDAILKDDSGLKAVLPRLHSRFLSIHEDILAILCMYLYGEKPQAVGTPA